MNLTINDPERHINAILGRGFRELHPGVNGSIRFGPVRARLDIGTTGLFRFRCFVKTYQRILIETHFVHQESPQLSYYWLNLSKNGLTVLKQLKRQFDELVRDHRAALNHELRTISGSSPSIPRAWHRKLARVYKRIQALHLKYKVFLDHIRVTHNGDYFYTLLPAANKNEYATYVEFIRSLRNAEGLGPNDERHTGKAQPGAGAPALKRNQAINVRKCRHTHLKAAQEIKSLDDPQQAPDVAQKYRISEQDLTIFIQRNKKGKYPPSAFADEKARILADQFRTENKK